MAGRQAGRHASYHLVTLFTNFLIHNSILYLKISMQKWDFLEHSGTILTRACVFRTFLWYTDERSISPHFLLFLWHFRALGWIPCSRYHQLEFSAIVYIIKNVYENEHQGAMSSGIDSAQVKNWTIIYFQFSRKHYHIIITGNRI